MEYKFKEVIIARTVDELLGKLRQLDDCTRINQDGIWIGTSRYIKTKETFVDAFDHTVYQTEVLRLSENGDETYVGFYHHFGKDLPNHQMVWTVGELRNYLIAQDPQTKLAAVDDNFELGGAITVSIKLLIKENEHTIIAELT